METIVEEYASKYSSVFADVNRDGFLSREEIKQFSDTSKGQELAKLFEAESGWHSVSQK